MLQKSIIAYQTVLTYPFASSMFGEVWLPAQEFPWKWIQGFSLFSLLKGIQQAAPEQNTRHGVSRIAIKKNDTLDFVTQQSAQWDFITENTEDLFLEKSSIFFLESL